MNPRHALVLTSLLIANAAAVSAQRFQGVFHDERIGLLLGPTYSTLARFSGNPGLSANGNPFGGASARMSGRGGFDLGVFKRIPVSRAISLQPELHYLGMGARLHVGGQGMEPLPSADAGATRNFSLRYVELPLLLRFDSGKPGNRMRLVFAAGPSIALRATCSLQDTFGGLTQSSDCVTTELVPSGSDVIIPGRYELFKRYDAATVLATGVALRRSSYTITTQFRFRRSLISVAKNYPEVPAEAKNSSLSLLIGIGH